MNPVIIEKVTGSYPYDLLLLADPSREFVDEYLLHSDCFVVKSGDTVCGVIVVRKEEEGRAEIMNLAVDESFQGHGYGKSLLEFICNDWAKSQKIHTLKVCTGTSSAVPFMLYQKVGFDLMELDRDYFVRHYPEPIWENGVQCRHRLILEKKIK